MRIVRAKIFIGAGLRSPKTPLRFARHRTVIDPHEIWPTVESIVGRRFEGFTIIEGRGSWEGVGEPSLIVEVWDESNDEKRFNRRIRATSQELVRALDQIAVAVVTQDHTGKPGVEYMGSGIKRRRNRKARR